VAKLKSFLSNLRVENAVNSHNCRHNKKHRVQAGTPRLRVKEGRSPIHYCPLCALESIRADIQTLQRLERELSAAGAITNS
jgi:hypothetical protein